ncbi:PrgI family protein [Nocardiopsis chromatogenes]|uniref:PrgI family protein n=1 Tax=Nocardiopsis chromatogenes TaxID=280239 RepID=UPI00034DF7DC|nr:PrgI family protein [Nocardiopsis chromatogenes]
MTEGASRWRARIPADIDRPEPVAFGLTGRQLLLIAPAALGLWIGYLLAGDRVPAWAQIAVAVATGGVVLALALGERDGMGLDAYLAAGLAWWRSPKRRIGAPEGRTGRLPDWAPRVRGSRVRLAPLRLPASAIGDDGVITLAEGRQAVVVACSSVNFHLASEREQEAIVGAFAAVLDSLAHPVQVLIQARPLDLAPYTLLLRDNAPGLAAPALARAARDHADFLEAVQHRYELTCRQALLVVTAPARSGGQGPPVLRGAAEVAAQLDGAGIRARICDGEEAEALLREAMNPLAATTHRPSDD